METKETHLVPEGIERQRLSDYLVGKMSSLPSRKSVKKAIKSGCISVNEKTETTGHWVVSGEVICFQEPDIRLEKVFEWRIPVIYEDDYLAIINKPAGLPVSGNRFKTIENALPFNLKPSSQPDALQRFRPVHRLDSPTSGLLLIAKTKTARIALGALFEEKNIQKRYQAIVIGQLPESGTIKQPIGEKAATTVFRTIKTARSLRNDFLTLVDLLPQTGRTHQLRIHLSQLGFPILGDKLYGEVGEIMVGKGLFLAAVELSFLHPFLHTVINVTISPANKFLLLLEREEKRWLNYHGCAN